MDVESGAAEPSNWRELGDSSFGIICLTRDNLLTPSLLFEAGALSKQIEIRAHALLLNGLGPADVAMPLAQFQNRVFAKEEFIALVRDLNRMMKNSSEG